MGTTALGAPTKEFFVGMLTRDIELSDAILDLLDKANGTNRLFCKYHYPDEKRQLYFFEKYRVYMQCNVT